MAPLFCFLSNNWLVIWICLEVSTLTFTFIVIINTQIKLEPEASIKYFIIQSRASALLLALFLLKFFSFLSRKEKIILRIILILKIGVIPFHLWFLRITKTLNWNFLTLLMTWQKVAPIYLILFSNKMILIIRATISMSVGTILQYKNRRLRIMIAYSSIANSCWIITGAVLNVLMIILFISIYFLAVAIINITFKKKNPYKKVNI